jgi:hypothetical protein
MPVAQKVRNSLRGLVQRYAPPSIKRWLWNHEYEEGRWKCLDAMAGDCAYPHVERYPKNGNILDLGCGPGTIGTS